jgi:hypothetical protein
MVNRFMGYRAEVCCAQSSANRVVMYGDFRSSRKETNFVSRTPSA